MTREDRCKTKVFYDTEFQATVAAARNSATWDSEIITYPCGAHWHIANKDPRKRNQHTRAPEVDYCDYCGVGLQPSHWARHQRKRRHLRMVDKANTLRALDSQPNKKAT